MKKSRHQRVYIIDPIHIKLSKRQNKYIVRKKINSYLGWSVWRLTTKGCEQIFVFNNGGYIFKFHSLLMVTNTLFHIKFRKSKILLANSSTHCHTHLYVVGWLLYIQNWNFVKFAFYLFFFNFYFYFIFALQYCIGFTIHWHESATPFYF